MTALRDLQGQTFDRLTVVERGPNKGGRAAWWCDCICGTRCLVAANMLCSGNTRSCGCLNSELASQRRQTHGMSHSPDYPEYIVWKTMRQRCLNPRNADYPRWGGRGITICERWLQSFPAFLEDMGPRPSPQHTLERRDNSLSYFPENCVWATRQVQSRNQRSNRLITLDGRTACLAEWLDIKGIHPVTFHQRLDRGWSVERALTTPPRPGHARTKRPASP
jgi:hypothetical protein